MDKQTFEYLQSLPSVRQQCRKVYEHVKTGRSKHWTLHEDKLNSVVQYIHEMAKRDYPDGRGGVDTAKIPPHTRWRHYPSQAIDELLLNCTNEDEKRRTLVDLFTVSVILDAGAGATWKYTTSGKTLYTRSEGIAMAVLEMFTAGKFGGGETFKPIVTSSGLLSITLKDLQEGFQCGPDNQILGLEGRLHLLHELGKAIQEHPQYFPNQRLSDFSDNIDFSNGSVEGLWNFVINVLGKIWPANKTGFPLQLLKDVWWHDGIREYVPFHKLSQWLTYSLIEPLEEYRKKKFTDAHLLTGLPEYRNGGLLIDFGMIEAKNDTSNTVYSVGDEAIVEWRALTIILLDTIANQFRRVLDSPDLPLAKVLEAGTWKAGRAIAAAKRPPTNPPPINIRSDGTVF